MASQETVINTHRIEIARVLTSIEAAQARAAALVQEYNKLGGSAFLAGYDWTPQGITEAEFLDAQSSLATLFPDILTTHGTNLYNVKPQ